MNLLKVPCRPRIYRALDSENIKKTTTVSFRLVVRPPPFKQTVKKQLSIFSCHFRAISNDKLTRMGVSG